MRSVRSSGGAVLTDTEGNEAPRRPSSMRFRAKGPKLSSEEAKRQGEVTHFAFLSLGGRDAALAFLNTVNAELGGRPIDLAVASAEGAEKVNREIRKLASADGQD